MSPSSRRGLRCATISLPVVSHPCDGIRKLKELVEQGAVAFVHQLLNLFASTRRPVSGMIVDFSVDSVSPVHELFGGADDGHPQLFEWTAPARWGVIGPQALKLVELFEEASDTLGR